MKSNHPPPTYKGIFSMAAAQATGWHAMSKSAADAFRKENYIIADIVVYLKNPAFRNFQDEDLPPAVLRAIGTRLMLDGKTIQSQGRYFKNKSSQWAAVGPHGTVFCPSIKKSTFSPPAPRGLGLDS